MLTVKNVLEVSGGVLLQGSSTAKIKKISIDSRTIERGDIFLAIKGERHDGHNFVAEALRKGAVGAIVSRETSLPYQAPRHGNGRKPSIISVADTVKALQDIAHFHRGKFKLPIVAIAGSNGKTTTKDILSQIFSQRMKVLSSEKSFNNEIGVPLTLLRLSAEHEIAVMEIEMNELGGIASLAALCRPTEAIITNTGHSHLEFFNSLDEVATSRGELLSAIGEDGTSIINADDRGKELFFQKAKGKIVTFGIRKQADFQGKMTKDSGWTTSFILNDAVEIKLSVPGYGNLYNALAAAAAAAVFGISLEEIKSGIEKFSSSPARMEILSKNTLRIINDTYNANPESMKMAISVLANVPSQGRRVAILGDMLELGARSNALHRDIGRLLASSPVDVLMTVGSEAAYIAEEVSGYGKEVFICSTTDEAEKKVARIIKPDDLILVKGSRALKMEKIINALSSLPIFS
jgi:UDP-N-acetylmuramoyl-tripeptide--D-alanyl-D-alanine ligase